MQLSVIIVNYNVRHFLAQCLLSAIQASKGLSVELVVVDNHSQDGSVEMLKEKFADKITLIANTDNPGFSKANNQGIRIAKGEYILLLNPDTLVQPDTFQICLDWMQQHPETGGLGVKMLDGSGKFLPESKRALPTPWVSFYKIFGLAALFPRSKRFGKYHLTYLDKNQNHEIEILSGAYMFMRKSVLDQIGYLDEDFFMYGEDIDLSYRILLGGYKNHYLSDTKILHYKGESTKKGSLNYVKVFYQAMIIFANKHFSGSYQQAFIFMIQLAVYLRAAGAILYRLIKKYGFALSEMVLFYLSIYGIKEYWEHNIKYIEGGEYPFSFDYIAAPIYTIVFSALLWISGGYKKPYHIRPLVVGTLSAFVGIATVSYVFPHINFSRAIVGLSSIFALLITLTTRGIIHYQEKKTFFFTEVARRRALLVGNPEDLLPIISLLQSGHEYPVTLAGYASNIPSPSPLMGLVHLGTTEQLRDIIQIIEIDELIFCHKSLSAAFILSQMEALADTGVAYKIVPPDARYIVGAHAIHTEETPLHALPRLKQTKYLHQKRKIDLICSGLGMLFFPLTFFTYTNPSKALHALWGIFSRKKHFVGYAQSHPELPPLLPSYFNIQQRVAFSSLLPPTSTDAFYAQYYRWEWDLEIILRNWRRLGK